MFGYITVNKDELKVKNYNEYHAYYCGLCRALRQKYGYMGQMTLTYDMTFLVILLTSLYEVNPKVTQQRCTVHMGKKHTTFENKFSSYAADMNILLSYHNLMDDWLDEKKVTKFAAAKALEKCYQKVKAQYPRQSRAVEHYMEELSKCEQKREEDLDIAAGHTGNMLGELFVYKEDEWQEILRRMGFFMGKFIYLMDAYEDVEEDAKQKRYNPFVPALKRESFEEDCRRILMMMAGECSREFEKLPILENAEILRNILYSGIWAKYEMVRKKRTEEAGNDDGSI